MAQSTNQLDLADRRSLIESLPHFKVAAEIGVASGALSEVILARNAPRELWLVDSWKHRCDCGADPSNAADDTQMGYYLAVLRKFHLDPRVFVLRAESVAAAAVFPDHYFDWLHLDSNHLQVREDIEAWWPKVKPGGWLTGHDYTVAGDHITVKRDLDALVAQRGLELFVTRGEGDIYEKNYPSWAFRRP